MKQRLTTLLTVFLLVGLTFSSGYLVGKNDRDTTPVAAQDDATSQLFAPFWEAWGLMHQFYVDPLNDTTLMEGALNGMMQAPGDRHTDYMNPERYIQAREGLSGEYEGIGATVRQDETTGALIIVRPLPGSPAEAAGILPGDQVVSVDGEDITGLDQDVIIGMVKGTAGTEVVLGVLREGNAETLEISVTRARIALPAVEYELLENNIGYILLYNFGLDSPQQVADALRALDAENLDGLVFDLRGNTGGYLDTTLEIISMFVERGTIFIEREANGVEEKVQAYGNPLVPTVPIVILTDEFSASASEVMAGALQDHERAVLLGTKTFGKGSVQTWRDLSNGGGIRITIARWFTPLGRSVEPNGIEPDIPLEFVPPAEGEIYSRTTDNQIQAASEYLQELPRGPQANQPANGGF